MSATKAISTIALHLAKNVRVGTLDHLWMLINDEHLPACSILAEIAKGQTIDIPGELSLYPDGRLTIYAPFAWDGPSPRAKVRYRGKVRLTVGTPLGPYMRGTRLRATCRGSLVHDRIGRSVKALAKATGLSVATIREISDRRIRRDISEDWSPRWGRVFYRALRAEAAAGYPYRGRA